MKLLKLFGLGQSTPPAQPEPPKATDPDSILAHQISKAKRLAADLPDALDFPFFHDLGRRWPTTPTISSPVSQLCTASQFEEDDYIRLRALLRAKSKIGRKQWEFIFILRSLEIAGHIAEGRKGLGFGVGKERLPSLLAAHGCQITATDLPPAEDAGDWAGGAQHAVTLNDFHFPRLVEKDVFTRNVAFRPVNMKAIPDDLQGYDFCWSACAFEHLGGLEEGWDFVRNSIACLRPGGLAVHTTEFNLGSAEETLTEGSTVVYREKDILAFAEEMRSEGHSIELNLSPGDTPTDRMIDRFRDSDIHIRLYVRHQVPATSIGLAIRKAGP